MHKQTGFSLLEILFAIFLLSLVFIMLFADLQVRQRVFANILSYEYQEA